MRLTEMIGNLQRGCAIVETETFGTHEIILVDGDDDLTTVRNDFFELLKRNGAIECYSIIETIQPYCCVKKYRIANSTNQC
jgi:hypothetical protein